MPKPGSARLMPTHKIARSGVLPYLRVLVDFFRRWVRTDVSTLAASLAVLGGLKTGLETVFGTISGLRMYLSHFFTSSVTISGDDILNSEVIDWLCAHVLERKQTRSLSAKSNAGAGFAIELDRRPWLITSRDDRPIQQQFAIKYLPTFNMHYFWFEGTFIMVQRNLQNISLRSLFFDRSTDVPTGKEPLLITSISRSVDPIKKFLAECKLFAEFNKQDQVVIKTSKLSLLWDTQVLRSPRPLESVHFDQQTKDDLVADIAHYLKPETREFYQSRGIPYRRGYLLHGPPGTGKSSLSFAIAGHFNLELMLVELPSVRDDRALSCLFSDLPAQCVVLIEDIDAVGLKRKPSGGGGDDDKEKKENNVRECTLSGLLNVLDGVVAQQGRIVLMTTNCEAELDEALTRPGRIDRKIYLGNIGARAAREMFVHMYAPDHTKALPTASAELLALADRFAVTSELDGKFTPAQVQEYLLQHRDSPQAAVEGLRVWVEERSHPRQKKGKVTEKKTPGGGKAGDNASEDNKEIIATGESDTTGDAAEKDEDKNDLSKNSSDVEEVMILSTEDSSSNQSNSSDSKDSPVEPDNND
ncbi:P-loop containing nucleoside triphosphate hydrolase protein [Apiospora rasikravindrae]|uniref:P-loop containing nucleoside triphosphate hydrolase protein n=1 Tax=Apiospora rasikravindrae TaxID=990691 RepID=A0ABR1RPT6_9PEZI